ncbi:MAG: hypothetical protein EB034_19935, partial [Verrucomicrobia bacterium]|nr:hypothetical protein [Verrucomicrobiota bacterium]
MTQYTRVLASTYVDLALACGWCGILVLHKRGEAGKIMALPPLRSAGAAVRQGPWAQPSGA